MAVEAIRAVGASMPVGRGAAPLAVLLVIDVFMKPIGAVCAPVAVVRAVAVSAFRAHSVILLIVHVKQFLPYPFARNGRKRKTSSEEAFLGRVVLFGHLSEEQPTVYQNPIRQATVFFLRGNCLIFAY